MEQFNEIDKNDNAANEGKKSFKLRKLTKKEWEFIFDKFTTGLLILLMASPVLILIYIFSWFLSIAQF